MGHMTEDDGVIHICEACREQVDPSAPNVVRYVRYLQAGDQWLEGLGEFYHRSHAPTPSLNLRLAKD